MKTRTFILIVLAFFAILSAIRTTHAQDLYVGSNTPSNTLDITAGTNAYGSSYVGYDSNANSNTLTILNSGTLVTNSDSLFVGFQGSGNGLVVSNGATVANSVNVFIGFVLTASNNAALVTGAGSLVTNSEVFNVGYLSSGNRLDISNAGVVASSREASVGVASGANHNIVNVTGAGSLWTSGGNIMVGGSGSHNELVVSDGGQVINDWGYVGRNAPSSNNVAIISGEGSRWINGNYLWVGDNSSGNRLIVSNGAEVVSGYGNIGFNHQASSNSVLVTGLGSVWSNVGSVAAPFGSLHVGPYGGGNSLAVSNGGKVVGHSGWVGGGVNNSALVTGAGSTWTNSNLLGVGGNGADNSLTVADGGSVAATSLSIALGATMSGTLNVGRFGTNDAGGAIIVPTIAFGSGTGAINFNQSNAVTITSVISGNGTLNQLGNGRTTFTGDNTYTGATTLNAGTMLVDGSANSSTFTVHSGGTLGGSGSVGGIVLNLGSTVSPGNSPGTFNVLSNAVWNPGANYNWQVFNASGTKGGTNGYDWMNVSGSLDLSALSVGNEFNINLWSLSGITPDTNGSALFFTNTSNYTWTILTASNGIVGFNANKFVINTGVFNGTGGFANALGGGTFSLLQDGNDLNLRFTAAGGEPVPEPGTWAAAALLAGGAAFVRWRRRQAQS
jgi:T5SS/PEP-CTERM-associated repeat protein